MTKMRAKLRMMSYDRSGIVMTRGRPMRHLPSICKSKVTEWLNAKLVKTPKLNRTIAIPNR